MMPIMPPVRSELPGGSDPPTELAELLAKGDEAFERGDRIAAHVAFRDAQRIDGNSPEVLSRLGLTLTVVARDELKGIAFCEEAVRRGGERGDLHWRLAQVYVATFQKARAVQVARRGIALDPQHPGLQQLLVQLGFRRRPVFPFLARSNPLNKYLGMLRHRLLEKPKNEE